MNKKKQSIKMICIKKASDAVKKIIISLSKNIYEGNTGKKLEYISKNIMDKLGVISSSYNYNGFPSYICVSVNNVITHGIPNDVPFKKGDIISVDVSCSFKGYHSDSAYTFFIKSDNEKENEKKIMLINSTKKILNFVVSKIIPNVTTNKDIGKWIEFYAKKNGLFTVKEYGGHGIGNKLHMEPFIPNYGNFTNEKPSIIKDGMFICIEPLVKFDDCNIKLSSDSFSVLSSCNCLSAHFEHTIFIRKNNTPLILTEIKDEFFC